MTLQCLRVPSGHDTDLMCILLSGAHWLGRAAAQLWPAVQMADEAADSAAFNITSNHSTSFVRSVKHADPNRTRC